MRERHITSATRPHLTPVRRVLINSQPKTPAGEEVRKREPSDTVGGKATRDNHYGKHNGGTSEAYIYNYLMT